jgi:hypothetical protein
MVTHTHSYHNLVCHTCLIWVCQNSKKTPPPHTHTHTHTHTLCPRHNLWKLPLWFPCFGLCTMMVAIVREWLLLWCGCCYRWFFTVVGWLPPICHVVVSSFDLSLLFLPCRFFVLSKNSLIRFASRDESDIFHNYCSFTREAFQKSQKIALETSLNLTNSQTSVVSSCNSSGSILNQWEEINAIFGCFWVSEGGTRWWRGSNPQIFHFTQKQACYIPVSAHARVWSHIEHQNPCCIAKVMWWTQKFLSALLFWSSCSHSYCQYCIFFPCFRNSANLLLGF